MSRLRTHLSWKLIASYLIVILVGVVTIIITTEAAIPTAFNRHLASMQRMMMEPQTTHNMAMMANDLFRNFRAAVIEALAVSVAMALISAIVVSLFVSRRIVTPIRQMMQASRRIAAGHYRERVDVGGEDELAQLAASFNQMAGTLEKTETMRRNLIADVAHEMRTPVSNIKGYMEGLMDGVLPTEPDTYHHVYQEADRLQRLVDDLHELSRVEAGVFELTRRPVQLAPLIERTVARLYPQFKEKDIQLKLQLPPDLPLVDIDSDRISQVLVNLIGNALQYTPSGGCVTVEATAASEPSHVNITVRDTGIGIAAEDLPHLFTRFYRVDKSRSRAGGGSGIGLTIVQHLVEAHKGEVWAHSLGVGEGSTFGFSLPLA